MPQVKIALPDKYKAGKKQVKRHDAGKALEKVLPKIHLFFAESIGITVRDQESAQHKEHGYAGMAGIQEVFYKILR